METIEIFKQNFGTLSDDDIKKILPFFLEESLPKNEFFTHSEKYCNRLSLIKSGILRIFSLSNGKEITQWLSTPNYFVTELSGFFFDQPNRWSIQAITDVELLTITKENYQKLCFDFPKWLVIEKQFITKCFGILEDRVFAHLSMSAEERYEMYYAMHYELFNQVPLQYIASLLGMTPETLSRIRKKQSEKS